MVKKINNNNNKNKNIENKNKKFRFRKKFPFSHKTKNNNNKNESKSEKKLKSPNKNHFFTFQTIPDLFTLLYSSIIFKWINSDRLLIITSLPKTGYQIDIFLRTFRFNSIFLDKEMPINTNLHFYNQYLKGIFPICIANIEYNEKSPNFCKEIIKNCPIPITIILFDSFDKNLLEFLAYNSNVRSIYHFISDKEKFIDNYNDLDEEINFEEFSFDVEQMNHLKYRCEDVFSGIKKSDIQKEKTRKINIELLHSKKMEKFFEKNPNEKLNIIKSIEENTIKNFRPSTSYLPSYLIHKEQNPIADAIKNVYSNKIKSHQNRRRNKKRKMEQYFEALDKNDGSSNKIKF